MKKAEEIVAVLRQKPLSENKVTGMVTDKTELKVVYLTLHDGSKVRLNVSSVSVIQ